MNTGAAAPVLVFCYRRPAHLQRTLESLRGCVGFSQSKIIVYGDGPRDNNDKLAVENTRALARATLGDLAEFHFHERNLGLARSIISGVSETLQRFDSVIVLEDDLVLSPHFLTYMNDGLRTYRDDKAVASIHGYSYPTGDAMPETFFLRGSNCWGWATWARAWRVFNENGVELAAELKNRNLIKKFDLNGSYPYFKMLHSQINGRNDSWAVRWHASTFLAEMYTLYPGRTLVENVGMDGSGEHCRQPIPVLPLASRPILVQRIDVIEDHVARQSVIRYMQRLRWHLIKGRLRYLLLKLRRYALLRK